MASNSELKNHLDNEGRLIVWPSKRTLQLFALDYLATKFEVGLVYSEKEVNALLNSWHTFGDPALLRRELHERRHRILAYPPYQIYRIGTRAQRMLCSYLFLRVS